ncbi:MAG: hypothetical protein K9H49_16030 [Bacteroidales bacterium]|nr:hypothetical protein [Bacteroidales bacterium]MCF8390386.1 hypothetical protein [Bacteroidales bacterium]
MKQYFKNKVLTTYLLNLVLFFSFVSATAQNSEPPAYLNPKYGPDSISRIQCAYNLSNISEYMKINLPEYAIVPWRTVFNNTPEAKENIYVMGAKIYQDLLSKTEDPQIKAGLFDTLMLIYDRRIQYFGNEGYVLGRKGVDIILYNETEFQKAYEAFSRSAELSGIETSLNVVTGLAQTALVMYNKQLIDGEEFLNEYFVCKDILADKKAAGESLGGVRRASTLLDKLIEDSNFTSCEPLEAFFSKKFSTDSLNVDLMQLAVDLLIRSGCENSAFFSDINVRLLKLNPDPAVAYRIAKFNLSIENYQNAAIYFIKAIEIEDNIERRAMYQYQLAQLYLTRMQDPQKARYYAQQSIESKSGMGEPYLLIAAAVVEGIKTCDSDAFTKQAINWLAVDYCIKAKSVDPTIIQKADDLISKYKAGYPSVEETFFRSLQEGDSYTFNCWINETTRVKVN